MRKPRKKTGAVFAILIGINILWMTGCGKTESESGRTGAEALPVISEGQQEALEAQSVADTVQIQEKEQEQSGDTEDNSGMRAYSDKEQERMKELQEAYQKETAKPEKKIEEVESAEDAASGALCYIVSTGQFYLPDRELTDEELLEIIDCNFRIAVAVNANGWTQEKMDEENRKERADLEEKIKAAKGISEDEAVAIAQKTMENDLGGKAKNLKLHEEERYGWKAYLYDITDWAEYKDKGDIAYMIQFDNVEEIEDLNDLFAYECVVNAIDGSICGASSSKGLGDSIVWYLH